MVGRCMALYGKQCIICRKHPRFGDILVYTYFALVIKDYYVFM